jgi:hypothetical protein
MTNEMLQQGDAITVNSPGNGVVPDWWSEAPERPDRWAGESDAFRRMIPLIQRGCPAVMQLQTAARRDFRRLDIIHLETAGRSGPIMPSFESLVPLSLSPTRQFAFSPL